MTLIESNNPEINVDELMRKVEADARKITALLDFPQLTQSMNTDKLFATADLVQSLVNFPVIGDPEHAYRNAPFLIRKILCFIYQVVLFFLRPVIQEQRHLNLYSLKSLQQIADLCHQYHSAVENLSQALSKSVTNAQDLQAELRFAQSEVSKLKDLTPFSQISTTEMQQIYTQFEDRFRGSDNETKNKLLFYNHIITQHMVGRNTSFNKLVLDLGCGRGEWIKLLRDHNISAIGVDNNTVVVERTRSEGLQVELRDCFDFLAKSPSQKFAAVTCFHLVEHLRFDFLVKLLNEMYRVLDVGGMIILESPNPNNVHVGSSNFYFDPTHLKPIPGQLLQFLAEQAGFKNVEIHWINAFDAKAQVPNPHNDELTTRFNNVFYGPQDYAIIGRKE